MTINYANLILYLSVMGITPGPNNLTCLYLGGRYGLKKSMRFIFASGACIFIKSVVCGVFSMALAETIPKAVNIVKWLGAAYMLYLAYSMMKSGFVKEEGAEGGQEESGNPAKSRNDSVETKIWACSSQTAGGNIKVRKEDSGNSQTAGGNSK
ncbi:MAG: LysE family transporter, partial [Lachnospiraceae bacterium]|nr:LysE family transporter [Lachnospiraceae bacterium]